MELFIQVFFIRCLFLHQDVFGGATAKILGTYEKELEPFLNRIQHRELNTVLNIGAAEG